MKYLPSIFALLASALTIFTPQLQGLVSSHPSIASALAAAAVIIAHLLPSPVAPTK